MKQPRLHIRLVFVQLLFALVIGQLALRVGDLVIGRSISTTSYSVLNDISDYTYVYTHFLFCVILISTSWVGWQASKSSDNPQMGGAVFSIDYVILLIDIFLVICYFIIVRATELSSTHFVITGAESKPDFPLLHADSTTERFWTLIIFTTYLLWDFITKLVHPSFEKVDAGYKKKYFSEFRDKKRFLATAVCFMMSVIVYKFCTIETADNVVNADFTLIFLVLTFRGWKQKLKPIYQMKESQIPSPVRPDNNNDMVDVVENMYRVKKFLIHYLPVCLFIVSLFIYWCRNK